MECWNIIVSPGDRLECQSNIRVWALTPDARLSTDVFRLFTAVQVLWDGKQLSETLLAKVNVLTMVSYSWGNDQAFLRGDVVHNEFLENAGIQVINVSVETEAGHAEGLVTIRSSEEGLLGVSEWVVLGQVIVKIVGLVVLSTGNVSSQNWPWLQS